MRLERVQQKGVPGLLKDTVGQRYFLLPESKTSWTENTRFSCVFRTFGPVAPMAWHRIYPCCSSKMKTCDHNVIFHIDNFITHKVSTVLEAYEAVLSPQTAGHCPNNLVNNTRFSCNFSRKIPLLPRTWLENVSCFKISNRFGSIAEIQMSVRSFYARPVDCNSQWVLSYTKIPFIFPSRSLLSQLHAGLQMKNPWKYHLNGF